MSDDAPMTFGEYARKAARTATLEDTAKVYTALGLAGEAGEVVDMVKKVLYHGHDLDREKLTEELGDIAWYMAVLCLAWELDPDDIFTKNIEKLWRRYPDGFSHERSRDRQE